MIQECLYQEEVQGTKKIFVRRTAYQKRKRDLHANPMELPLCARCVKQFYDSPWHRVHRMDPCQVVFDTCAFCNVRRGYDYRIFDYRKPVVKEEDIYVLP